MLQSYLTLLNGNGLERVLNIFICLWIYVCIQTPTACAVCSRSVCVSVRHMEVKEVCQTESVVLFWQKSSEVSVIPACPFFLPISACWIWGKKGRKAVKARCLCPPFLLMINVWLFSEEKCLGIRAFEVNYLQALSIFKSCRHDNSMWWQSHTILSYLHSQILEAAFISNWLKQEGI